MPSLDEVIKFRNDMHAKSTGLLAKKGADYNRDAHEAGDTLFNIRVAELLGIVVTAERGILVRLSDKFMRLISLVHPDRDPAVVDESVLDTIADIHNYVDFLGLLHSQRKAARENPASPLMAALASPNSGAPAPDHTGRVTPHTIVIGR